MHLMHALEPSQLRANGARIGAESCKCVRPARVLLARICTGGQYVNSGDAGSDRHAHTTRAVLLLRVQCCVSVVACNMVHYTHHTHSLSAQLDARAQKRDHPKRLTFGVDGGRTPNAYYARMFSWMLRRRRPQRRRRLIASLSLLAR